MKLIRGKKGFDANQMFIYIVSIVVVGLIMVFGYNAVQQLLKSTGDVEVASFKKNFEKVAEKARLDHGSIKTLSVPVPGQFSQLCVIDLTKPSTEACSGDLPYAVCQFWQDYSEAAASNYDVDSQNLFFVNDKQEIGDAFYIKDMRVAETPYAFCVNTQKATFRFTGQRKEVFVEEVAR
jgi:hypothetical protein